MRGHRSECDTGICQQVGAHRRMAMKIDIGIERTRHLGTARLLDDRNILAAPAVRKPLRFFGGDEAFVEADLAALANLNIDASALALRSEEHTSDSSH